MPDTDPELENALPPEEGGQGAPTPARSAAAASLTRKQRRIGEAIVEGVIRSVATISIVAIFLIFLFVFREASPMFFGEEESHQDSTAVGTADVPEADVYNPESGTPPENDTTPTGSETDVYNPETGAPPATPLPTASAPGTMGIGGEDYPILSHDSPVRPWYLAHEMWQPVSEEPRYGIYPIILGTLKTTFIALLIATPLGILAAIFTAFFAPKWVREYIKPAIELLAAFPSVVIGFFCLMTVASAVQWLFGTEIRLNAVVGGIGLALAVIPIIFTITDDALRSVPSSLREAALALGASEWQAAYQVMLPSATPGIFAAVLLGLGRAFGETMIALMATGNAVNMGWDVFVSVRTFAATIGAEMGEVVVGSPHYQVLFFLGVLLFVFSLGINLVTEFWVKQRLIKRFRGTE